MRIAYVINSVEGGGAQAPVPAVTRVMRDHGADIEIFALTRRDGRALDAMRQSGLTVHVRRGGEKDHWAAFAWLDRWLEAWRPDLVWTSLSRATLLGQIVGMRLGAPVVSWQHAAFLKPANRRLLRLQQSRSALWIADSQCVAELTAQRLAVPRERLAVWPLFAADPGAPQARPWRAGEPIRIGSLGRLHRVKGHDVLLTALARLKTLDFRETPRFELTIAGEGPERAALERRIAELRLDNVRLAGFCGRPGDFLAGLHVYVQPSRSEGLCLAAHEAMQAGLPTVVSAVGEMPYSVRDGETGLVVPPDAPESLAQALAWLLHRPDRLAAIGVRARARVLERFGAEAFARAGGEVMARLPLAGTYAASASHGSRGRPATGRPASRRAG
jgi:glycosyltransferase involved in cell wall biosynthesis